MKRSKAKVYKVIWNPELQAAIKGFVPVFGNETDRIIVSRITKLESDLEKIDNEILRGKDTRKLTKKMKDIKFFEGGLISAIISRNMDF